MMLTVRDRQSVRKQSPTGAAGLPPWSAAPHRRECPPALLASMPLWGGRIERSSRSAFENRNARAAK